MYVGGLQVFRRICHLVVFTSLKATFYRQHGGEMSIVKAHQNKLMNFVLKSLRIWYRGKINNRITFPNQIEIIATLHMQYDLSVER